MIGEPGDARQSAGKVVRTLASVWKVTRDPDLDPGVPPAPLRPRGVFEGEDEGGFHWESARRLTQDMLRTDWARSLARARDVTVGRLGSVRGILNGPSSGDLPMTQG